MSELFNFSYLLIEYFNIVFIFRMGTWRINCLVIYMWIWRVEHISHTKRWRAVTFSFWGVGFSDFQTTYWRICRGRFCKLQQQSFSAWFVMKIAKAQKYTLTIIFFIKKICSSNTTMDSHNYGINAVCGWRPKQNMLVHRGFNRAQQIMCTVTSMHAACMQRGFCMHEITCT